MQDIGVKIKNARNEKNLTQEQLGTLIGKSSQVVSNWERGYTTGIIHEDIVRLAKALDKPYSYFLSNTASPEQRISEAISDDPELQEFWNELTKRDDLQLLFKQTKDLPPDTIKRIIKYIKVVEDEEAEE